MDLVRIKNVTFFRSNVSREGASKRKLKEETLRDIKYEAHNIHTHVLEGNIQSLEDQICSFVEERREFEIQKKKVDSLEKEIEFLITLMKNPQTDQTETQEVCVLFHIRISQWNRKMSSSNDVMLWNSILMTTEPNLMKLFSSRS